MLRKPENDTIINILVHINTYIMSSMAYMIISLSREVKNNIALFTIFYLSNSRLCFDVQSFWRINNTSVMFHYDVDFEMDHILCSMHAR